MTTPTPQTLIINPLVSLSYINAIVQLALYFIFLSLNSVLETNKKKSPPKSPNSNSNFLITLEYASDHKRAQSLIIPDRRNTVGAAIK